MLVSVIIPTRNRSVLLKEAIESVLAQEPFGGEIEILVADDGSTDDTAQMLSNYSTVRRIPSNAGCAGGTRNVGIHQAKGEWIAFLDDDDVWLPNKLKSCFAKIEKRLEVGFVTHAAYICDHLLNRGDIWTGPNLNGTNLPAAFLRDVVSPTVVLVRLEVLNKVGCFITDISRAEDRDMWLRILESSVPALSIPTPLALYRLREQENGEMLYKTWEETRSVLNKHFAIQRTSAYDKFTILRQLNGWYADRIWRCAMQARIDGDAKRAAIFATCVRNVSPIHWIKFRIRGT